MEQFIQNPAVMDLLEILEILFYYPLFFLMWGACWGSFLNVVVYRWPLGLSVVSPPSACPKCKTRIKAYDNIPVLSWFILGGKCRKCKQPYSIRYALIEGLCGLLCAIPVWVYTDQPMAGLGLGHALMLMPPIVLLSKGHKRLPWYLVVAFIASLALFMLNWMKV